MSSMTPSPRRFRLAAAISLTLVALAVQAQTGPAAPDPSGLPAPARPTSPAPIVNPAPVAATPKEVKPTPEKSALTAELFYEVLMGEITLRSGDPGAGYALVLDAARRTRDEALFQRAVEIALQARSGDAALAAARAWQQTLPETREGRRYELQILIALNRLDETAPLLRAEVAATPLPERPVLMAVIARNYSRAADKQAAARVVEAALVDEVKNPATAGVAWATIGRLRVVAGDAPGALQAAIAGQAADAASDAPAVLALDLMVLGQPEAEAVVQRYLAGGKASPDIRIAYAQALIELRRYADATTVLSRLTADQPELPVPWVLLASLQGQARQDAAAEKSALRYVALATAADAKEESKRGLTQAYLLLSQLAERRKDYTGAARWLARIDGSEDRTAVQLRSALLLARQGKVQQAREMIRALPAGTAEEKARQQQAELQVLREAKQYQLAYDFLAEALVARPDDPDLLYDQAMTAEKLQRLDEMERLLRRLIELKPDNHNAYNALGYSLADRKLRLDEARTLIRKAVDLSPQDPFIADSLGWVEFRLGNTANARTILEAAYQRRPDPEIGAHLGEVLWSAGERDAALKVWREAALADAENETLQETLKRLRVKL
ncbi:putative Zn-dependent protease [Variovorax sp. PvP013]